MAVMTKALMFIIAVVFLLVPSILLAKDQLLSAVYNTHKRRYYGSDDEQRIATALQEEEYNEKTPSSVQSRHNGLRVKAGGGTRNRHVESTSSSDDISIADEELVQERRGLDAEEGGGVSFEAPAGKVWKPTQIGRLSCSGENEVDCDGLMRFCLMDMATYHQEPWKYPLEPMLMQKSGCNAKDTAGKSYMLKQLRKYMSEHPSEFMRPSGFIYHQTRCGSTLVANMLAHVPSNMVSSESSVPLSVLSACRGCSKEQLARVVKDVFQLMGRTQGGHTHSFFKFQSAKDIAQLSEMFPKVPWIYLFRDPEEVIISNLKGAWGKKDLIEKAKNGKPRQFVSPCLGGNRRGGASGPAAEVACMRFLTRMNELGLKQYEAQPEEGMLVEYTNLPDVMIEYVYPKHFGMEKEGVMQAHMPYLKAASEIYSKSMAKETAPEFHVGDDRTFKENFLNAAVKAAVTAEDKALFDTLKSKQKWRRPV